MEQICDLEEGIIVSGGFNECYVHIILQVAVKLFDPTHGRQAAVAGLACIGVVLGMCVVRDIPRLRLPRVTGIDSARGLCCGLLFLVGIAEFLVGVSSSQVLNETSGIEGGCIAIAAMAVGFWQQQEVRRGLGEQFSLKIWWLLTTAAQVLATYDRASKDSWVALGFSAGELVLCTAATAAYLVPTGRVSGQPSLEGDGGISLVGGAQFARTISTRDPSPEEHMGIAGWLAFSWFTPIVDLAYQRDQEQGKLELTDVYPLTRKNVAARQLERLDQHWQVELRKEKPALLSAMTRAFRVEVFSTAWVKFINDCLHFVGPFLLNRIVNFVKHTGFEADEPLWMGYAYAIGMVLSSACQAFLMAHYFQGGYQTGMRLRTGLILMSYSKALRVLPWATPPKEEPPEEPQPQRRCCKKTPKKKPALPTGGMGQMTNIISADTDKFTFLMPYFNLIWSCPLQIVICFFMLAHYVQWALFAGVFVMIIFTIVSSTVAGKARKIQQEAMKAKDERLKMEVELLKIVKIIKFYAWEVAIEERVKELRNKELKLQLRYKLWNVALFLSFSLSPVLVALGTFACYTLLQKKTLDAARDSYRDIMRHLRPTILHATAFTALSLFNILSFPLGAMPMMARFFMEAAVAKDRIEAFLLSPEVSARPSTVPDPKMALQLQSKLEWPDKSVLLEQVDISVKKGEMLVIVGKTGVGKSGLLYAMLGELPIATDAGKAHLTGSVGYCSQNAWIRNATLRDNITSSSSVEHDDRYEAVLDACALRADLHVLPDGDQTAIGDRGINLSGGQKQRVALARAVYANPDIYILDDVLSALDSHVTTHICENLLRGPLLAGKTVILVTHSPKAVPLANRVVCLEDKKVSFNGSYEEFKGSGAVNEEVIHEDPENSAEAEPETNSDTKKDSKDEKAKETKAPASAPAKKEKAAAAQEERRSGAVSWHVYGAYAKACGGVPAVGTFLVAVALSEGSRNFSDGWLAHWSNKGGGGDGVAVYALAALVCLVTGLVYSTTRVLVGQRGSRVLHEKCLNALLRAHMSFFDLTRNGQILNRLAEDTNILDYNLPQTMSANIIWFWRAASIVVICMLVGWYLIFLMLPMFLLYARLAKRYLPATRDLRRLDAAARSPIFSHFSESMQGVSTIRAMQHQEQAVHTNMGRLETQMEAYYLSNTAARWLSLRLQFNGTILVGAVSILGIYLSSNNKVSSGLVGLAITYALRLTDTLNQVNRESADRETQMVSVERVQNYVTNVKQEAALRVSNSVQPSWPSQGNIQVSNVKMRYRDGLPIVLDGISLDIKAGQRVGIVGRTGCGKSSFLSTFLRLVELEEGSIVVDGVDISGIGLHDLREKVAMIPQDPAILTGTVRFNLDPFGKKSDEELWEVLEKSQLKPRIESAGGLDSKVEEGGGNYSVGELQLLCLARALLRRQESGGLLLLDEATSALDAETDQTIQKVIRSDFNCTIITIAHRIQTLMDYDKVAVFEGGKVVEFDSPQELMKRESKFQSLAKEGGAM